ncbi:Protein of unknown function (DUF2867) [Mycolicibacterium chubuense NBB4]|uniref:DUF2867 domain-containing protein n=1 Tax=Mycolicibacterium chubuense (strain NBB4) TaxID=710421 RepID=I4BQ15_MYCCN|nr:hypothetical protein [Mycolicibacterium chubuense]AFM19372.1 Protein of unknown function (DUF2867) [Mycolicibacterium chubuense NBB4]
MTIESDTLLACCTLARVDHVDTHVLPTARPTSRSPEMWMREILENTSAAMRARLTAGWAMLGLKLHRGDTILGWPISHNDAEYVRLHRHSPVGLTGQLVTRASGDGVQFATFVQLSNPAARALWRRVLPTHLEIVRSLLREAGERAH